MEHDFRPKPVVPNDLPYCRPGRRAVWACQIEEDVHLFYCYCGQRNAQQQTYSETVKVSFCYTRLVKIVTRVVKMVTRVMKIVQRVVKTETLVAKMVTFQPKRELKNASGSKLAVKIKGKSAGDAAAASLVAPTASTAAAVPVPDLILGGDQPAVVHAGSRACSRHLELWRPVCYRSCDCWRRWRLQLYSWKD